jgi:predicted ferric reductase
MNKSKKFLWLAAYFLSPLILFYFTIDNNSPQMLLTPDYIISTIAGTFAYTWLSYQFILSAHPKFIVKQFGMDKTYRFHGIMAGVSLTLGLIHFLIRRLYLIPNPAWGLYALILFALISGMAALFLLNTRLREIQWIERLRQFVEEKVGFKRHYSVVAHNLSLVAATLLFIHVLNSSASDHSPYVRFLLITLYVLGLVFWLYHQIVRRFQLQQGAFQVIENRVENSNVRSLHLKPLQGKIFDYKPGQFTFISVQNGRISKEPKPYTIASSPSNPDEIEFVIKNSGEYTSQLQHVLVGDEVHVNKPFGIFSHLNHPAEKDLVFVAGGIGITPFLSMLRWIKDNDPQRKVILLWGCRYSDDVIKQREFSEFEESMINFEWRLVLSDESDFDGETGFFDTEKLNRLAVSKVNVKTTGFYVCAPPAMMNIVGSALQELGVPKSQTHYEKFSF